MIFGYARVSTDGQTLDAQRAALREAGATRLCIGPLSGFARGWRHPLSNEARSASAINS
jgi:DNA invertase Pin-like site-specific DNA recombinase